MEEDFKQVIFWDFDGVLMDSMPVRNKGFELVLQEFSPEEVARLMTFHLQNGGLSRYVKFRYFFETIRGEEISDEQLSHWASRFSEVMKAELIAPELLIKDSMDFVRENYSRYRMHVVSGSDGKELNFLCDKMGISKFFKSIHGSPVPKIDLVRDIIRSQDYNTSECMLIGDSINDLEAATINEIKFVGYNNPQLKKVSHHYIESFREL